MAEQFLQQVEQYTEVLYGSHTNEQKAQAFDALQCFTQNLEYFERCKFILDNSKSMYAMLFASSSLGKLLSSHWNAFTQKKDAAFDFRNYLLGFLWNRGTDLPNFVLNSIIELLCLVTKLSWVEDERQQAMPTDVSKFLSSTPEHGILGLRIFNSLIEELNKRYPSHTISVHRQISILFRENGLKDIFERVLENLTQVNTVPAQNSPHGKLLTQTLKLAYSCLSFDFIGTAINQANEDLATIQIPTAWRPKIEDGRIIELFYSLYAKLQPRDSVIAMEIIALLTAVRSSLFSSIEIRRQYLSTIMTGMCNILQNNIGLQDADNHHQFCRLLARMKSNYQLSHIIKDPRYDEWLALVCDFSCKTFHSWQWAPNSLSYLLSLWSRMVSAHQNLHESDPQTIPEFASKVMEAYITSRVNAAVYLMQNPGNEDPLDDPAQLQDQLDTLPFIVRCNYTNLGMCLINMFMPLATQFQQVCTQGVANEQLAVLEGQLAPLMYIIGSLLGGRVQIPPTNDCDEVDGQFAARSFQLLSLHDRRLAQRLVTPNTEKLERGFLSFISQFRKAFIGDKPMANSKVYVTLQQTLGLTEPTTQVMEIVVQKIITNLNWWMTDPDIVGDTLRLFRELASTFSSSKALGKSQIARMMLAHHTAQHFQFLSYDENSRNRTAYYATLGKLLFSNATNTDRFGEFVAPFSSTFESLKGMQPESDECKRTFVSLMRDIRGIVSACQSKATLELVWEWLYPKHTEVIVQGAALYYNNSAIMSPLLKLASQLSYNRAGRLNFDCSSANGILLFRELSKIVVNYGSRIDSFQPPATQRYAQKLKGICTCLTIIQQALAGNYVNFGVFELYGDPALNDALNVTLKLAISVPHEELIQYPKLKQAFYMFVFTVAKHHLKYLVTLESAAFQRIANSIQQGLQDVALGVFHESASALEFLACYFFLNRGKDTEVMARFKQQLVECPELFTHLMSLLFQVLLFVETANRWAISRAMLPLILLHPDYYKKLTEELIQSQPLEHRQTLVTAFESLMQDVEPNLQTPNRELFTRQLSCFRQTVKSVIVAI